MNSTNYAKKNGQISIQNYARRLLIPKVPDQGECICIYLRLYVNLASCVYQRKPETISNFCTKFMFLDIGNLKKITCHA